MYIRKRYFNLLLMRTNIFFTLIVLFISRTAAVTLNDRDLRGLSYISQKDSYDYKLLPFKMIGPSISFKLNCNEYKNDYIPWINQSDISLESQKFVLENDEEINPDAALLTSKDIYCLYEYDITEDGEYTFIFFELIEGKVENEYGFKIYIENETEWILTLD